MLTRNKHVEDEKNETALHKYYTKFIETKMEHVTATIDQVSLVEGGTNRYTNAE